MIYLFKIGKCKECGSIRLLDWVGWCRNCTDDLEAWVEEMEEEGKSAYGLEGWDDL